MLAKYIKFLSVLLVAILITGCSTSLKDTILLTTSPDQVAQEYFHELFSRNFDKAYEYLADYEKKVLSKEAFIKKEDNPALNTLMYYNNKLGFDQIYNLNKISETSDKIVFSYTRKTIDPEKLQIMIPELSDKSLSEDKFTSILTKRLAELYDKKELPITQVKDLRVSVVKEAGFWKIDLDKAASKKKVEEEQRLQKQKIEKYKDLIIFSRIEPQTFSDGTINVKGVIQNKTGKAIKYLSIKIYFLDKSRQAIYDSTETPVFALTENSEYKQLKSNYYTEFSSLTTTPLLDWSGKFKFEIVGLEFAE